MSRGGMHEVCLHGSGLGRTKCLASDTHVACRVHLNLYRLPHGSHLTTSTTTLTPPYTLTMLTKGLSLMPPTSDETRKTHCPNSEQQKGKKNLNKTPLSA